MPIRIALSGKMHGPDLVKLICLLGVDKVIARVNKTMDKIG